VRNTFFPSPQKLKHTQLFLHFKRLTRFYFSGTLIFNKLTKNEYLVNNLMRYTDMTKQPQIKKKQEREQRILDAAADLILRWGYDKTAMDDISRKSGVAKGTIYLHWKTREELFEALLRRESLMLGVEFLQRILEDTSGATLRSIYKHAALALIRHPLLKAVLLGEQEMIGRLARTEQNQAFYQNRWAGFFVYLDFLRKHHLIRTDLSLRDQAYSVSAIFSGYFMLAPLVPTDMLPSDEEMADLIGEAIHRMLETDREVPAEEQKEISAAFVAFLSQHMQPASPEPVQVSAASAKTAAEAVSALSE
jgi:AcrR family transcriptional regulator